MLSLKQGKELVKFARNAINKSFKGDYSEWPAGFSEKLGVFVTLLQYPSHDLRGCIGFPYPTMPLGKAVVEGAKAAAFCDPRFNSLQKEELETVTIEISVLTEPKEVKCSRNDLPKNIQIGKDGLIVSFHGQSGLLLPQVPVEWKWNSQEFIKQACMKAGLNPESWKNKECKIFKFQAQIFSEEKPNGKIIEKVI